MSQAIWEFAQSGGCSAQYVDPQIMRQSGNPRIAQMRSHLVAQSADGCEHSTNRSEQSSDRTTEQSASADQRWGQFRFLNSNSILVINFNSNSCLS